MLINIDGKVREMTEDEEVLYGGNKQDRIVYLKQMLAESDYKAIKHSEGLIDEVDYAPIKVERQAIREEINRLEEEIRAVIEE